MSRSRCLAVVLCLFVAGLLPAADGPSSSSLELGAMDTAASPCQNFYRYACSTWRSNNPVPPDRARRGRFNQLAERNLVIEQNILEQSAAPHPNRTAVEKEIGDYYAACMDEAGIEARGIKPLEPALARIQALSSKKELADEVAYLYDVGAPVFFAFGVVPDLKNSETHIAAVRQGGISLPDRDYYVKDDPRSVTLRQQYEKHVGTMLELLAKAQGKSVDTASQARAVMALETALAKASVDRIALRDQEKNYRIRTVAQLEASAPDFDWKHFFSTVSLAPIEALNVAQPEFFRALSAIIEATSLDDLKAYLTWRVLNAAASELPKAFDEENFNFNGRILAGAKEQQARWKRCVTATDSALGEALGQKFVEVAFSAQSKQNMLRMVGEIEHELAKDINAAKWMSPATKKEALAKLHAVANKIGYPNQWRDYSSIRISRDDHFGNTVRSTEFQIRRNFGKLGKPQDKNEWRMTPPTVNAYYSLGENNINFPAGILQPPFYNEKASDAVNYGAIGTVIGHELTHGFDDQGRRFDGQGNLRDWWTASDARAFEDRADCIVHEYDGFSPTAGVNLKGKLTLGENAADNGGIRLSFYALMDHLAGAPLSKLDGFTPQQQFFLGFAQMYCENSTDESIRLRANTDPHSPGEFRVNGVLQNFEQFPKAFSCKEGDAMVSAKACRVW